MRLWTYRFVINLRCIKKSFFINLSVFFIFFFYLFFSPLSAIFHEFICFFPQEYTLHLYTSRHMDAMKALVGTLRAELNMMRNEQREEQKSFEAEHKGEGNYFRSLFPCFFPLFYGLTRKIDQNYLFTQCLFYSSFRSKHTVLWDV